MEISVLSHEQNAQVHSRFVLVHGCITRSAKSLTFNLSQSQIPIQGEIQLIPHNYSFPTTATAVCQGTFKAFLHLLPGLNQITFVFYDGQQPHHATHNFTYLPLLQNPPLHIVILLGSDSPCTYDAPPDAARRDLQSAIAKLRLAGYVWQAYTASEMSRAGFGQRTFRIDEEWIRDTLHPAESQIYRQTARIHILRCRETTAQIRDLNHAQQYGNAKEPGKLFDIALSACSAYFGVEQEGSKRYVAAMFLDSTRDPETGTIVGHAALGGGTASLGLAIFGSHTLFSWPETIPDLIPALTSSRSVDTAACAIDAEGTEYGIAANIGIGAFLHEVGHLFGCPHQRDGIMLRDYLRFVDELVARPPLAPDASEVLKRGCHWHRLDLLRFRTHPAFRLPSDPPISGSGNAGGIDASGVEEGLLLSSRSGIVFIEFYDPDDEFPISHLEFDPFRAPVWYVLTQDTLRQYLHGKGLGERLGIEVHALDGSSSRISIDSVMPPVRDRGLSDGCHIFKSSTRGLQNGVSSSIQVTHTPISYIRIWSGLAFDGIEFDGHLFGKRGGHVNDFSMVQGEFIRGFGVRSGAWVDAVQIITNKRRSEWFGNKQGGGTSEMLAPNGYRVVGVYGEVTQWVQQLGLLYQRLSMS